MLAYAQKTTITNKQEQKTTSRDSSPPGQVKCLPAVSRLNKGVDTFCRQPSHCANPSILTVDQFGLLSADVCYHQKYEFT